MQNERRDRMIATAFLAGETRQTATESERLLLGHLFRAGSLSQADLTELLPLSQQSISRMAAALEHRGLAIRGEHKLSGKRGQPSAILTLDPDYAYTVGISLRADTLAVNLTDFAGRTRAYKGGAPERLDRDGVFAWLADAVDQLVKQAGIDRQRLLGLGVAVTGFRVGGDATFNTPSSLEGFALTNLVDLFSARLELPAWVDNDGNAAAVAENMTGVGRRTRDLAYFYIATGIGGGIIQDGKLTAGRRGNAGEFAGILPIDLFERRPTLELLRRRVNGHGLAIQTVAELVERYDDDWPGVEEWIAEVAPALSLMASSTAAILDTDYIVLGGLIPTRLAERLIPRIDFFDIGLRSVSRETARVVPAECIGDAAAIGASLLPLADLFFAL